MDEHLFKEKVDVVPNAFNLESFRVNDGDMLRNKAIRESLKGKDIYFFRGETLLLSLITE